MERREDIRAAIHKLLAEPHAREKALRSEMPSEPFALNQAHLARLEELQKTLRTNHIEAEIPEIVHAMLDALVSRPALCRGLIAAYLLGV